MSDKIYDVIIIGGGPGGMAAGLYASRGKLETLMIEKGAPGGQANTTEELENYPGFPEGMTGPELMDRMAKHAQKFGTQIIRDEVVDLKLQGDIKEVKCTSGTTYLTWTVILAPGAEPKMLGCKGELEFRGKGVSYCATCDADFFTDLEVVVVGGGDSAVEEALYLTKFAEKVTLVHRRNELRATKILQERAFRNPKLDIIWDTVVDEIKGDGIVESVVLRNVKTGEVREFPTNGVFMFVGTKPNTEFLKGHVEMDERGYIITNENMETNVPGVYAAGDCRQKLLRQVITAAADGAIAAFVAERYITEHKSGVEK